MDLTKIMKRNKVTSQELAKVTGIGKRTIDDYRQGRFEPSFVNGLKIAKALYMDPFELAGMDGLAPGCAGPVKYMHISSDKDNITVALQIDTTKIK